MSQFVMFSYPEGSQRVWVRLELSGRAEVAVTNEDGGVAGRFKEDIDTRDARRLITDLFSVSVTLCDRAEGEIFIDIGDDNGQREYRVSIYDLPGRGLEVNRIMRLIANDLRAGYEQRGPRRMGGPRRKRLSPIAFVGWAAAFAFGYIASVVVGQLMIFAGIFGGAYTAAIAYTLSLFLMTGSFYSIGLKFGENYRGAFPAWAVAVAGLLPLVAGYIHVFGAAGWLMITLFLTMPVAAWKGEQMGF